MQPCRRCNGTGKEIDWREVGAKWRKKRQARRIGVREMARRVGCSAAHVSDMELGRRGWTGAVAERVIDILNPRMVLK